MPVNPYQAPGAELTVAQAAAVIRSVFWKIFFVIYCVNYLAGLITLLIIHPYVFTQWQYSWVLLVSMVMTLFTIIGLFGYCFNKAFFNWQFWLVFFIIAVVQYSSFKYFNLFPKLKPPPEAKTIIENLEFYRTLIAIVVFGLLKLPAYIGLLLYALPSNPVWRKATARVSAADS